MAYLRLIFIVIVATGLNAIQGVVDGALGLGKAIISSGQNDPRGGADPHHGAAEHGAQSAILNALANGHFGRRSTEEKRG